MIKIILFLTLNLLVFIKPTFGQVPPNTYENSGQARISLLQPVKVESPRDTLKTFMTAMEAYRKGLDKNDRLLINSIDRAVRTLDLSDIPFVVQKEQGREIAKLLKEVIDRVVVVNFEKVPDEQISSWRLRDTEIKIAPIESGDRKGEYLFTKDTARRAKDFYQIVKHLPYLSGTGHGASYKEPWIQRSVPEWANKKVILLANWQWIGIFLSILIGLLFKKITEYLMHKIVAIMHSTKTYWRRKAFDAVEKPSGLVVASIFWLTTLHMLRFEGTTLFILTTAVQVILSISIIWAIYRLSDLLTDYLKKITEKTESPLDDQLVPLISKAVRIFIIIFGALVMFQNLGFNVMSVLAGLGLGGLAFALAAKDTCSNLFGSIMIFLDRPFSIGDWIVAGKCEGTVVEIGFRSTRLRTFYNSLVAVPNSTLANENIDNMGAREFRRIRAVLGLTYDTPPAKIEAFVEGIKTIIKNHPNTRKDYYHVVFNSYGDYSLNILVYCFLKVPDWPQELADKQEIYLSILKLAETLDINFAFPTSSIHVESLPQVHG